MVTSNADRFIVLTGGPGSGKTTLLDALEASGFARTTEAGRAIIQDQLSIGGHALPWDDRAQFAELMLSYDMRSYRMAETLSGAVFFDRSVVDVLGYLRLVGLPVSPHLERATQVLRHNSKVFIAPPWREIFQQDQERKQNFNEAIRTFDALTDAYQDCGYELVELPRASVAERVDFMLQSLPLLNSLRR